MNFDLSSWFEELYIHETAWDSEVAKRARDLIRVPAVKVNHRPYGEKEGLLSGKEFSQSKKRLYLAPQPGEFFKRCPGQGTGLACCNYYVLNLGLQCNMNCSYCYLQSYINTPVSMIYTNLDDALKELDQIVEKFPQSRFRVGTGEVTDSLSLDDLTHYSARLVEWFSRHPHLTLELKTKSDNVKNFIYSPHAGNTVVGFSVNPQAIIESEEHQTANLDERLLAARLCADQGFPVAFHFDPLIHFDNWKDSYAQLVDKITERFEPSQIRWISAGALRYPPEMKTMVRSRFGLSSHTLQGELFLSRDGKLRYDQEIRDEMFRFLNTRFKEKNPRYSVYLCMEMPETWLHVHQAKPKQVEGLGALFEPVGRA